MVDCGAAHFFTTFDNCIYANTLPFLSFQDFHSTSSFSLPDDIPSYFCGFQLTSLASRLYLLFHIWVGIIYTLARFASVVHMAFATGCTGQDLGQLEGGRKRTKVI